MSGKTINVLCSFRSVSVIVTLGAKLSPDHLELVSNFSFQHCNSFSKILVLYPADVLLFPEGAENRKKASRGLVPASSTPIAMKSRTLQSHTPKVPFKMICKPCPYFQADSCISSTLRSGRLSQHERSSGRLPRQSPPYTREMNSLAIREH